EVRSELPVATLADEIETPGEGRLRALVTVAGNPVLSAPNGARLDAALSSLEFMVSVDPYCNETPRHADVILPPPSALERSHYDLLLSAFSVRHVAKWSPPVLRCDAPSEGEILARLALIAAGQGSDADPGAVDALLLDSLIAAETRSPGSPIAGREPGEIRAALEGETGADRAVDFLLRTGPWVRGLRANPRRLLAPRVSPIRRPPRPWHRPSPAPRRCFLRPRERPSGRPSRSRRTRRGCAPPSSSRRAQAWS